VQECGIVLDEDRQAGSQKSSLLRVLDQSETEAVIDAAAGVAHLEFREHPAR
jgi:hypothetical protein